MNDKEKKFIDYYSKKRLNNWKSISLYEKNITVDELKKRYNKIHFYLADKINISPEKVLEYFEKYKNYINEIQIIYNKFNIKKRIDGFNNFEKFLTWYKKQKKECFYCKTSDYTFSILFKSKLFKPKKDAWKFGTLQIDRKNPVDGYNEKNCVLACVFCNNAKSDLISANDFVKYFRKPMNIFLRDKAKIKLK